MLKEIAVSAISMAKDICGTIIHIIIGIIIPFVNKCDVTDTLLPHGAAKVSFQPVQPTQTTECNTAPNNNAVANTNMHIRL